MKDIIRQFILSRFLAGESADNLRDDTPLQTSGILDSLGTLELTSFLEQQFGIELDADDTSVEHFDRIDDIASRISSKRQA